MKAKLSGSDIGRLKKAAEELHETDRDYRRASNFDFTVYLLLVFLVAFSVRTFVGEPIRVDGSSMHPTLLDNERMVIEKITYYTRTPKRGEIIVCYYPGYTISCVKRVVGLPGETVSVLDGKLYINGNPLDESTYWDGDIYGGMQPFTVREGHVFVVGDNRNHSSDSRDSAIGDIAFDQILGRAICVMWPFENVRSLV